MSALMAIQTLFIYEKRLMFFVALKKRDDERRYGNEDE
jgi:hypothetical protein